MRAMSPWNSETSVPQMPTYATSAQSGPLWGLGHGTSSTLPTPALVTRKALIWWHPPMMAPRTPLMTVGVIRGRPRRDMALLFNGESLTVSVADDRPLPSGETRRDATLVRKGPANCVAIDAIRVEREREVLPPWKHSLGRVLETLVDLLVAEVRDRLVDPAARFQHARLAREPSLFHPYLVRPGVGAEPLREADRGQLVVARRQHGHRRSAVFSARRHVGRVLWDRSDTPFAGSRGNVVYE